MLLLLSLLLPFSHDSTDGKAALPHAHKCVDLRYTKYKTRMSAKLLDSGM